MANGIQTLKFKQRFKRGEWQVEMPLMVEVQAVIERGVEVQKMKGEVLKRNQRQFIYSLNEQKHWPTPLNQIWVISVPLPQVYIKESTWLCNLIYKHL